MGPTVTYNAKNPAVKRILQEARELASDTSFDYTASPLEENIFEWHFTIRGPVGSEFQGGKYHGRILLPAEYPFKPPALMFLTPNGRFELNKKICLSITSYHEELWQAAWGVRTALLGLIAFLPSKAQGAIGGVDFTPAERKILADRSRSWTCPHCGVTNLELLPDPQAGEEEQDAEQQARNKSALPEGFSLAYEGEEKNGDARNTNYEATGTDADCEERVAIDETTARTKEITTQASSHSAQDGPRLRDAPAADQAPQVVVHSPPVWIDRLLFALFVVILALIVRKVT